ncbi:hypothetical protein JHK87_031539 [Glycine soja]|nr:hypothetical protein JHK87_031539 [Glycine soja]
MLLQNVNTEVALKRTELETQCELVLRNKVLAQVWTHNLDSCEGNGVQCTEQGCVPHLRYCTGMRRV